MSGIVYRYRQFKLINAVGAEYDLCDPAHAFYSPDGLGFSRNISTVQVGSAFARVESKLNQQVIKGEMRFTGYEEYSAFRDFIATGGLVFAYRPKGFSVWYYRTVEVTRLDKSEIDYKTRKLICGVDFSCFSQWYEKTYAKDTVDLTGENTVFPLVFPFLFSEADKNELVLLNDRVAPAPCRMTIAGPCVNPAWTLRQGNDVILTGAVSISLSSGEKLIVDANIESMRIVKLTTSGTEVDVYQHSDFGTARFIYAPTGESRLTLTHSTGAALACTVEVRQVSDTV